VAIDGFKYTPGDLTASGALGLPPLVARGSALQFGNFDAAGQVFHSVTACRAPCNRSTGVSYPLADGQPQFDSGQLGYGPDGFTAAAQRADWKTPRNLGPGTYTYFCRVHPYMRGAFRVAGKPEPGGRQGTPARRARLAILTRRARLRRGRVALRVRCRGRGVCRGVLRLKLRRGHRMVTVGRRRFRVAAGRRRVLRIKLNRTGRREVRRRGSVRLVARAGTSRRKVRVAR
jgi:hypothetical protein